MKVPFRNLLKYSNAFRDNFCQMLCHHQNSSSSHNIRFKLQKQDKSEHDNQIIRMQMSLFIKNALHVSSSCLPRLRHVSCPHFRVQVQTAQTVQFNNNLSQPILLLDIKDIARRIPVLRYCKVLGTFHKQKTWLLKCTHISLI